MFIVGAAAVNPEIADTFDKLGLNSLQGYGLTECAPLVAGNTDFFKRNDSAGLPIPNVEYKIDNPDSEGLGFVAINKKAKVLVKIIKKTDVFKRAAII